MNTKQTPALSRPGSWIALGVAFGLAIGVAMHNVGVGIAVGVAFGVAMDFAKRKKKDTNVDDGRDG